MHKPTQKKLLPVRLKKENSPLPKKPDKKRLYNSKHTRSNTKWKKARPLMAPKSVPETEDPTLA